MTLGRAFLQYTVVVFLIILSLFACTRYIFDDYKGIIFTLAIYTCAVVVSFAGWLLVFWRPATTKDFQIFLISAGSINLLCLVHTFSNFREIIKYPLSLIVSLIVISGLISTFILIFRLIKSNKTN